MIFIRLNIRMCALRKASRLSQYPVTEVAVVAAITALASYGSDFLRYGRVILNVDTADVVLSKRIEERTTNGGEGDNRHASWPVY